MGNCGTIAGNQGYSILREIASNGSVIVAPRRLLTHAVQYTTNKMRYRFAQLGVVPKTGFAYPQISGSRSRITGNSHGNWYSLRTGRGGINEVLIGVIAFEYNYGSNNQFTALISHTVHLIGTRLRLVGPELNYCSSSMSNDVDTMARDFITNNRPVGNTPVTTYEEITLFDMERSDPLSLGGNAQNSHVGKMRYSVAEMGMRKFNYIPPTGYQLDKSIGYVCYNFHTFPTPAKNPITWNSNDGYLSYDDSYGDDTLVMTPRKSTEINNYVRGFSLFTIATERIGNTSQKQVDHILVQTTGSVPIMVGFSIEGNAAKMRQWAADIVGDYLDSVRSGAVSAEPEQQINPLLGVPIDARTSRKYGGNIMPNARPQAYNTRYYSVAQGGYVEL